MRTIRQIYANIRLFRVFRSLFPIHTLSNLTQSIISPDRKTYALELRLQRRVLLLH